MPISFTFKRWNQKFCRSIAIVIVSCIVLVTVQFWAMENGFNRAYWVGIFFLVMLVTMFLVKQKKRDIRGIANKKKRDLEVARLKLEAEKTAGFALVFALGLFYQFGFEFDKSFTSGQALQWHSVNEQIQANMTETFCSVVPTRKATCEAVKSDMNALFSSIYSKSGESTEEIAQRIIKAVQNDLEIPQGSDQAKAFAPALATLDGMGVSEGILNFIAKSLPIMSVVFGCVAVSSKIAVASVDVEEREAAANSVEDISQARPKPQTQQVGALQESKSLETE